MKGSKLTSSSIQLESSVIPSATIELQRISRATATGICGGISDVYRKLRTTSTVLPKSFSSPIQYACRIEDKMSSHEALNPIHPSVLPHLDPVFINLYNTHVANTPNKPIDLSILRSKYSVLYSYGTGPAPEPAKVYDAHVPGHNGDLIPVRVYEPTSPGPWPVHIDFHGGGKSPVRFSLPTPLPIPGSKD